METSDKNQQLENGDIQLNQEEINKNQEQTKILLKPKKITLNPKNDSSPLLNEEQKNENGSNEHSLKEKNDKSGYLDDDLEDEDNKKLYLRVIKRMEKTYGVPIVSAKISDKEDIKDIGLEENIRPIRLKNDNTNNLKSNINVNNIHPTESKFKQYIHYPFDYGKSKMNNYNIKKNHLFYNYHDYPIKKSYLNNCTDYRNSSYGCKIKKIPKSYTSFYNFQYPKSNFEKKCLLKSNQIFLDGKCKNLFNCSKPTQNIKNCCYFYDYKPIYSINCCMKTNNMFNTSCKNSSINNNFENFPKSTNSNHLYFNYNDHPTFKDCCSYQSYIFNLKNNKCLKYYSNKIYKSNSCDKNCHNTYEFNYSNCKNFCRTKLHRAKSNLTYCLNSRYI